MMISDEFREGREEDHDAGLCAPSAQCKSPGSTDREDEDELKSDLDSLFRG